MEESDRLLIISYSAGLIIVETVLHNIDPFLFNPLNIHVKLAPTIKVSSLVKIALYAKAAIFATSAIGIVSDRFNTF